MNYTELNHHSSISVITIPKTCTTIVPWGSNFNSSMIGDSNHIRKLGYGPENTIWNPDDWIPRWSESLLSPDDLEEQPGALWGNFFFWENILKLCFNLILDWHIDCFWTISAGWPTSTGLSCRGCTVECNISFLVAVALLLIWSVFCGIFYEGVFRV